MGQRTTILIIKPEGARVKKGELECELDDSALKNRFDNLYIGVEGAKAAYRNARLSREAAELAVREYREGIAKQDQASARGAIELARGELQLASATLEQSRI